MALATNYAYIAALEFIPVCSTSAGSAAWRVSPCAVLDDGPHLLVQGTSRCALAADPRGACRAQASLNTAVFSTTSVLTLGLSLLFLSPSGHGRNRY